MFYQKILSVVELHLLLQSDASLNFPVEIEVQNRET